MNEPVRVSEWTKASQDCLQCPKCLAANRPGLLAPYIEIIGLSGFCTVCSHSWLVVAIK